MKQCVYLQIVERVRRMCELGLYDDDGKLPSCRELADMLGVNPNTVQRAYSALESEGVVAASPKKGYFATGGVSRRESVAAEKIKEFKAAGISRDEIERILDTVYGGNDDND